MLGSWDPWQATCEVNVNRVLSGHPGQEEPSESCAHCVVLHNNHYACHIRPELAGAMKARLQGGGFESKIGWR